MDPLSDLLALLKPESSISRGGRLRPRMAVRWPEHIGIKCYAIIAGQCWLRVEGVPETVHVTAGDCFLLPPGPSFSLATDLNAEPIEFSAFQQDWQSPDPPEPPTAAGDGSCYLFGGHFILTGGPADLLLRSLPPIVHIRKQADKDAMRWSLERMKEETLNPRPGGSLISQQLAYMMLVQALRLHVAEGARPNGTKGVGWLFALADRQMAAAITCMHEQPGHGWTLQSLAAGVGMSRSVFAERFKATVGVTPMEYLTQWRMLLAGDRLGRSGAAVAEIASSLGYESESAFSKAFRRVMGCSPRQYGRGATAARVA